MNCLECDKEFIKTHHSQKICSKECVISRKKKWVANNPERLSESRKKWRINNPEKVKEVREKWRINNPEKVKEYSKKWKINNPEKVKESKKKWITNNPEKARAWNKIYLKTFREKNPGYNKLKLKEWKINNPEKVRASSIKDGKTHRIKYKNDPIRKMQQNMRTAMWAALSGKRKSKPTMEIIGCSVEELYQHFELCSSWEPWMTKENYGRNGWDVDHIVAISKWDSNCPLQFALCWDKSNLQPLEHIANIKKGNK